MIRRNYGERLTAFEFVIPPYRFEIWISSVHRMRDRRRLALELFGAIKPVLRGIISARINHRDGRGFNWIWNEDRRPFEKWPARPLETPAQRWGFILRMRRTELGLRLRDLAKQSGVHFTQLSRLENGRSLAHESTVRKLELVLQIRLPPVPRLRLPGAKQMLTSTKGDEDQALL